jgi:hypothetical protein
MPIVCGGDWNLIMENIDKKGGSSLLTHRKNREHLRQFMDRNDLIDIWRIRNPMEKRYSWRQKYPICNCYRSLPEGKFHQSSNHNSLLTISFHY